MSFAGPTFAQMDVSNEYDQHDVSFRSDGLCAMGSFLFIILY